MSGSDIKVALVVLSAALSGDQLAVRLGVADSVWSAGDRQSAKYSGWELSERASSPMEIEAALDRLISRARGRTEALDQLRKQPGTIAHVTVWLWADVGEDGCGFSVAPRIASGLMRLGATLSIRVTSWDEAPPEEAFEG
jgi:hypothetical protein